MRVRIITSIAGHAEPRYLIPNFSFGPGDTPELNDVLAQAWIDSGIAEPLNKKELARAVKAEEAAKNDEVV